MQIIIEIQGLNSYGGSGLHVTSYCANEKGFASLRIFYFWLSVIQIICSMNVIE